MVDRSAAIQEILRKTDWPVSEPHPCSYLCDRTAREEVFVVPAMDPEAYHVLMDLGWRRSGYVFYRPRCDGCNECVPIRVLTKTFLRSRSQRRVWRRNTDISVEVARPVLTPEKWELYVRYLQNRHDKTMGESYDDLGMSLYRSPVRTVEVCYRLGDRLAGAGTLDLSSGAASTVYFFFDPELSDRSLGVFSVLWEIEWCRANGIPHYYLGFLVSGAPSMSYKADYRPFELLGNDGRWRPGGRSDPSEPARPLTAG